MSELSPIDWAIRPIKRYADFDGRAPRAEYWWFVLATGLGGSLLDYADDLISGPVVGFYGPISLLFSLGLFIPGLAVSVRRLHDINRSGWWALLNLGSYIFALVGFIETDPEQLFVRFEGLGTAITAALVIGWLLSFAVLLVFMVTRGDVGTNDYGPDPYRPNDHLEDIFA